MLQPQLRLDQAKWVGLAPIGALPEAILTADTTSDIENAIDQTMNHDSLSLLEERGYELGALEQALLHQHSLALFDSGLGIAPVVSTDSTLLLGNDIMAF